MRLSRWFALVLPAAALGALGGCRGAGHGTTEVGAGAGPTASTTPLWDEGPSTLLPGHTLIARAEHPALAVCTKPSADEAVQASARELALQLGRMVRAPFSTVRGDCTEGIAVGLASDFPNVPFDPVPARPSQPGSEIADRQAYALRSHERGVFVVGATAKGVRFAVADLLHRLGYRQFFPHAAWEVVPHPRLLAVQLDTFQRPAYEDRRIWYGYGGNQEIKRAWDEKNRLMTHGDPDVINNAEGYGGFLGQSTKLLADHPEYLAVVKGQRSGKKLCLSNVELRKLMVRYAVDTLKQHPERISISMNPPDGPGWCECEACRALGRYSDRLVTLANEVAAALRANVPGKYVGILAYYQHAEPPTIAVDAMVNVAVATAFATYKLTPKQLLAGWAEKASFLGIYEYYAIYQWHMALPGKSTGANLEYLRQTIPEFHAMGARVMVAEGGEAWGAAGLGFYVASRLLWDPTEASQVDAIVEDFLTRAFGPAKEPMREFYKVIDGSNGTRGNLQFFAERGALMRSALQRASALTQDPAIRARLDQLAAYTHYVDLWVAFRSSTDAATKAQSLARMSEYTARIRDEGMVHWAAYASTYAGAATLTKKVAAGGVEHPEAMAILFAPPPGPLPSALPSPAPPDAGSKKP